MGNNQSLLKKNIPNLPLTHYEETSDSIFTFIVSIPVDYTPSYKDSENPENLNSILEELNLMIDAKELQIPNVNIASKYYHGLAEKSHLFNVLKFFMKREDIVYDMHALHFLEQNFGCPEHLGISCLEFKCCFPISDRFIDDYNDYFDNYLGLDEMKSLIENEYIWNEGLWCPESSLCEDSALYFNYPVMDEFSRMLYSFTGKLLALMNLSRTNSIIAHTVFIDCMLKYKEEKTTIKNIKKFNFTNIAKYMEAYPLSSNSMKRSYSLLNEITLKKIWEWHVNLLKWTQKKEIESTKKKYKEINILRALQQYFALFTTDNVVDRLLYSVAALEALYTFTRENKGIQLIQNIPLFLDVKKYFPDDKFEKVIKEIYDQRSRLCHGDESILDPFKKSINDDYQLNKIVEMTLFLLVCSLKKLCESNAMELPVPFDEEKFKSCIFSS